MEREPLRFARAPALLAVESREGLLLLGRDGSVRLLPDASGALAREVLAYAAEAPRGRAELVAHIEARTGQPLGTSAVLDELLGLLVRAGALVEVASRAAAGAQGPIPVRPLRARILVGVGGAVAAAHAPLLVQALEARGHEVRVMASPSALRLVSRRALEALTHRAVVSSTWPARRRAPGAEPPAVVPHLELAGWPDAVVLWPATAATIGRIATGDTSALLAAVALSTRAPVLVAPCMNPAMRAAPAVARNVERLVADGFFVLPPALALEVGDAPGARAPVLGGAPAPEAVARMLEALLGAHPRGRRAPGVPRTAAEWDALHRLVPEAEQPWFTPELDPDLARLVTDHAPPPGTLWDVGTGHGATAVWGAKAGYHVVATDVSRTALDRASARAQAAGARVSFVLDDVRSSALATHFDVVVDRGTFHVLPREDRAAYVASVCARLRPGGALVLVSHAAAAAAAAEGPHGGAPASDPPTEAEVRALFDGRAELVHVGRGTFAGPLSPPLAAATYVLRRRG